MTFRHLIQREWKRKIRVADSNQMRLRLDDDDNEYIRNH